MKYTKETEEMLKSRLGFRNDYVDFENPQIQYTDIKLVSIFESVDLDNVDIAETIKKDTENELVKKNQELLNIYSTQFRTDNKKEHLADQFGNFVFNYAKQKTKKDNPKCIWLAKDKYIVMELYDAYDSMLYSYEIPENAVVLSDLGYDGCLFAW